MAHHRRSPVTTPHRLTLFSETTHGSNVAVQLDGKPIYPTRVELAIDANGTTTGTITLPVTLDVSVVAELPETNDEPTDG